MSELALENVSGGASSFGACVRTVGKILTFPVRAVSYAAGAVVSSVPKGFAEGVYDAWTNWKDYDRWNSYPEK